VAPVPEVSVVVATRDRASRLAALLEESLTLRAVGRADQGRRPARQVGQHHRRDPPEVVDHIGFAEARGGVQGLVEVGERKLATVDLDADPACHT